MSRIKESKDNQMRLQQKFGIITEDRRQSMIVGMLADIADSLALLCDLYSLVHGIKLDRHEWEQNDAEQ